MFLSGAVASASAPDGAPLRVLCNVKLLVGSTTTTGQFWFVWVDGAGGYDDGAYVCDFGGGASAGVAFGEGRSWYDPGGGAELLAYGDWTNGVLGHRIASADGVFWVSPIETDFGNWYDPSRILYNLVVGFGFGIAFDIVLHFGLWLGGGYMSRRMIELVHSA